MVYTIIQYPMPNKLKKYIAADPNILGGTPVITGTRIPVERVYQLIKQGYSVEKLQTEYSWVDKKKLQHAIAYLIKAGLDEFEKIQKIQTTSR